MRVILCVASLCFLSAGITAHADDVFTLTGGGVTMTFTLPASPSTTDNGHGFFVSPISVDINGTDSDHAITFYNAGESGGLSIQDPGEGDDSGTGLVVDMTGAQLFTGSSTAPTFTLGTFDLESVTDPSPTFGGDFTLNITSAVPEPSSLALLGTGVIGLVGAVRRRLV